jgi:putative tricarboxylic transport membrane protein
MKFNDALIGAALFVLAVAIGIHIRGFPDMPGQKFGAALFPGLIAAGLLACGLLLFVRGVRSGDRLVVLVPWMRMPRQVGNFLLVCALLVFYILASNTLGFVPSGVIILMALFLKLAVPPLRAAVVAVVATLIIHALFYKLLRVPLPWGVLQAVAW